MFQRFTQLNNATRKYIGGTGLGLSIVKGLVGLLGGDITVCSQVGKGSTFTFTISYQSEYHSKERAPEKANLPITHELNAKTILIVE
ncbi:MAG TPA: ATP-binding protein, partial [Bacteroidales bacterium]|nr:ATP-binding protein [Bacteroidales bacterium]